MLPAKQINLWPYAIIGAFLLVFTAGGTTLYLALKTDPGAFSGAYEKGLRFDVRSLDLKTASELGLEVKANTSGITIKLPGKYSKAEISGAFASNKSADFSRERLIKDGEYYILNRPLLKGTWFLSLYFDDLELQLSRFVN